MTDEEKVSQALAELWDIVRCRCHEAYTGRGLHDPDCECDSTDALQIVTDRIEQLAVTNEALTAENKMLRGAVYIDDLTVTMQARDRSKAIEGIGRALDLLNADMVVEAKIGLRAALAEIKRSRGLCGGVGA